MEVCLHEDKDYYPSAEVVYPDVEVLVQEEDTQPLSVPLIQPIKQRSFFPIQKVKTNYNLDFLRDLSKFPEFIRSVVIVGSIHHGKTGLMDLLIEQTHNLDWDLVQNNRFLDTHPLERQRQISIKCSPISLVMQNLKEKSFLLHFLDTPGHVDFVDEVSCALQLCDGVLLVVDVVEGVMAIERVIQQCCLENKKIIVCISKLDRLILELKLPPNDAYLKIKCVLEEINNIIFMFSKNHEEVRISPERNNVCFVSSEYGFSFTLKSFAQMYNEPKLSLKLWGDVFYQNGKFSMDGVRTFVHFCLEPLYKIMSLVLTSSSQEIKMKMQSLNVKINKQESKLDYGPLLRLCLGRFFKNHNGLVDMITEHIPIPKTDGELVVHICKQFPSEDALTFSAFGRIISGTLHLGQKVRVLGDNFTLDDDEDSLNLNIEGLSLFCSRYHIEMEEVTAGNFVAIKNIGIIKSGMIVQDEVQIANVQHLTKSIFKVALEPNLPSELPKMLEGIRKILKTYPLSMAKVEESGEHVLMGTGELYMDCLLHDLRLYSEIEIKVSDPVTCFAETVTETSAFKCVQESSNNQNQLSFVCEPLEQKLINLENVDFEQFGFDCLAARSVWSFTNSNMLMDDTIFGEVNKLLLEQIKPFVIQGFQWACREGPLCDEPIRNTKFKLLEAMISQNHGGGQIIPLSRRLCHSSILLACPRLMEPVYQAQIQTTADCINAVYSVLSRRRGHVVSEIMKPGSPFFIIKAYVPVMDSFGFETDLRSHTQGMAFSQHFFDHFQIVPGDPLDKSLELQSLEPALPSHLARDFLLKTRRRKGLSDDVVLMKYFDQDLEQAMSLFT